MIEIENIVREFSDFSLAVGFSVGSNEIVSLLGSSGSGKTTTLRILAGFEQADSGRIMINGSDVTRLSPQQRKIGFVFQDYTLFPHLNVAGNIAYGLRAQGVPRSRHAARVDELLQLVGLEGFADRSVQTLSGGEQQRIALARALAPQPRALLLDEPFSAVDTERRDELRRHVVRIQRELAIPMVFVTHSQTEALSISDRIVILRGGRVVEQGTPQDVYLRPHTEYTARFIGRANILSGRVLVRPEHLSIAHKPDQLHRYPARITQCHYRGVYWEYDLISSNGVDSPDFLGRELSAVNSEVFARGQQVWLGITQQHQL